MHAKKQGLETFRTMMTNGQQMIPPKKANEKVHQL